MNPLDFSGHRPFSIIFIVSSLLLSAFAVTLYYKAHEARVAESWVVHTYEVMRLSRQATITALDIESAERAYLLTGADNFSNSYRKSQDALDAIFRELEQMVADNRAQQLNVVAARQQLVSFLEGVSKEMERYRPGHSVSMAVLEHGGASMAALRESLDNFIVTEKSLLRQRQDAAARAERQYFATLIIGAILTLGGTLLAHMIIITLGARGKQAEKALARSRETYRLLLDGIKDGIYDYEPGTGKVTFSPSYKDMLGYEPGEMVNEFSSLLGLVHPDDQETARQALEKFMRRDMPIYSATFRMKHKDGQWRWMLSRAVGIWNDQGIIQRMIGTHTDITDQKRREEEMQQLNADMAGVIYIVSHDLRAPLINLRGFANEIQQAFVELAPALDKVLETAAPEDSKKLGFLIKEDIPEALGFIRTGVERMDRLTSDVLDLSRIERHDYRSQETDAELLMQRCIDSQSYEIKQRGIEVICEPLPHVTTDPAALERIFANILDNAIKYSSPDRKPEIRIIARRLPWETIFTIRDNGRGIAPIDRQKVFDIFRRASNSGGVRGAGMGMAFVKAMLRKLGGRIWFDSELGKGTSFHFTIPTLETPDKEVL